uniref:Uncharacterized protein n=1 Tax=Gopherus agassizii TaxID=38772 RepID=A0A452J6I7_9SAUR
MELDHLVLLALMTVLFTVCSLPLIVTFAADFNEKADLTALRFISVNSIVDPWVFIIFRTSVFRKFLHRVCRRLNSKKRQGEFFVQNSCSTQPQRNLQRSTP